MSDSGGDDPTLGYEGVFVDSGEQLPNLGQARTTELTTLSRACSDIRAINPTEGMLRLDPSRLVRYSPRKRYIYNHIHIQSTSGQRVSSPTIISHILYNSFDGDKTNAETPNIWRLPGKTALLPTPPSYNPTIRV